MSFTYSSFMPYRRRWLRSPFPARVKAKTGKSGVQRITLPACRRHKVLRPILRALALRRHLSYGRDVIAISTIPTMLMQCCIDEEVLGGVIAAKS